MSRILPIVFLALPLLAGFCKNTIKTDESAGTAKSPVQAERPPEPETPGSIQASHVIQGSHEDTAATLQRDVPPRRVEVPLDKLPPASASRKAYLTTGWWMLNQAFQPSNSRVNEHIAGKFLKFREDQSFDILVNGQVVDSGRWNWDEPNGELYLSCRDPYLNNTWKVNDKGFVMIWKGNTAINVTGIQIRVANTKTPPASN